MADNGNSFFAELKRRNVYRVGIAYIVVAWLALQALDIIVPIIRAPEWFSQLVLVLLVIGLPFALIFAWAYEMTPEGLKREKDVDRTESITQETGQHLNRIIIGVLVLAVSILLVDKFFLGEPAAEPTAEVAVVEAAPAEETTPSIAVLPFMNMSADESSTYFSDGLADTLLHMLAQIREIRVAARTSSFQFRDQNTDITEIASALNVGTILEGSVQRAGNKIRVTAQLIEADTGYHLWSGNYDRDLDDIFAIQDEIANEVVAALKVTLLGESAERLATRETENLDAYTEYLLGVNDLNEYSFDSLLRAEQHLREAVRLDPEYALAWARLAETYLYMEGTGAGAADEMIEAARDAASRALSIDENLAAAMAVLGNAEAHAGNREMAEQLLLRAIATEPNDVTAKRYYAGFLWSQLRTEEAFAQVDEVIVLDPLSPDAHDRRSIGLNRMGDFDGAIEAARRIIQINPNSPVGYYREAGSEYARGNWAAGIVKNMQAIDVDPSDPELAMLIGDLYLAIESPADAKRWYDRASEIDPDHAVSRTAPVNLHLYNNDISLAAKLARQLLDDDIEDRHGSHAMIVRAIWLDAKSSGHYDGALNYLEGHFGHLFEDNPKWRRQDEYKRIAVGSMLIANGDEDRGETILRESLSRADSAGDAFGPDLDSVRASLSLGDDAGALSRLRAFSDDPFSPELWPIQVRNAPEFEALRDVPEFVELINGFEENAAKQREILAGLMSEQ